MTQNLSEAARKSRAAYYREWRRRNPEKQRKISERYWERKAKKDAKDGEQVSGEK